MSLIVSAVNYIILLVQDQPDEEDQNFFLCLWPWFWRNVSTPPGIYISGGVVVSVYAVWKWNRKTQFQDFAGKWKVDQTYRDNKNIQVTGSVEIIDTTEDPQINDSIAASIDIYKDGNLWFSIELPEQSIPISATKGKLFHIKGNITDHQTTRSKNLRQYTMKARFVKNALWITIPKINQTIPVIKL